MCTNFLRLFPLSFYKILIIELTGFGASETVAQIPPRLESISQELAGQQLARDAHLVAIQEQTTAIGAVGESVTRLSGGANTTQAGIEELLSAAAANNLQHRVAIQEQNTVIGAVGEGVTRLSGGLDTAQAGIQALISSSAANHLQHRVTIQEHTTAIRAVGEDISRLSGGLNTTQAGIEALLSATATNDLQQRAMMSQILELITGLSLGNQSSSRIVPVQDGGGPQHEEAHLATSEPCNEFMNIITRLDNRVKDSSLQGRLAPAKAKDILCDLLLALELIKPEKSFKATVIAGSTDPGVCPACGGRHIGDLQTTMTTMHGALSQACQVTVNDLSKDLRRSCALDDIRS